MVAQQNIQQETFTLLLAMNTYGNWATSHAYHMLEFSDHIKSETFKRKSHTQNQIQGPCLSLHIMIRSAILPVHILPTQQ